MAMQWQVPKERKISQSNVILEESTEKFKSILWQKREDKHHPGSTNVHLKYGKKMLMESGDLLSKYPLYLALGQTCDLTPNCCCSVCIRNPIVLQGRGGTMGASNNSTCRDPSRFELVENADTGHHCGHCVVRGMGHNSKTCPESARIMLIKRPVLEEPAME